MQIKTISTVAGVNEIDFGNDSNQSTAHFYWFKNLGNSTLYVSAKPNPVPEKDDVAELPAKGAASIETDEGKVYILGAGTVEVHRTNSKFCPFELPSTGSGGSSSITIDSALSETSTNPAENRVITGAINDLSNRMLNPNLLINPDFKINQRGISGTFSETGKYFVDRWQLVSGTVTVNSDRTITLNGSICQIFEIGLDTNVTASVSAGTITTDVVHVNTGEAYVYSVTILAEGETISWAKLEIGSTATPFSPPDPATELLKCQRYYQVYNRARQRMWYYTADTLMFFLPNKVPMRDGCTATINGTLGITALNNSNQSGFNFAIEWATTDAVKVRAGKTAHGLTDAILYVNGLPSGGQIEIDAEIY